MPIESGENVGRYNEEEASSEAEKMQDILEEVGALTIKRSDYSEHQPSSEKRLWANIWDKGTEWNEIRNIVRNYELASMLAEKNAQIILIKNESHEMADKKNQAKMKIEDRELKEYYDKGIDIIRHHVADYPGECEMISYKGEHISYPSRILNEYYQQGRDKDLDEKKTMFDSFPEDIQQTAKDFFGYGNVDLAKKERLTRIEIAANSGEISEAEQEQLTQLEQEGRLISCSFVSEQEGDFMRYHLPHRNEAKPGGWSRPGVDVWATVEKPLQSDDRKSMTKVTHQTM